MAPSNYMRPLAHPASCLAVVHFCKENESSSSYKRMCSHVDVTAMIKTSAECCTLLFCSFARPAGIGYLGYGFDNKWNTKNRDRPSSYTTNESGCGKINRAEFERSKGFSPSQLFGFRCSSLLCSSRCLPSGVRIETGLGHLYFLPNSQFSHISTLFSKSHFIPCRFGRYAKSYTFPYSTIFFTAKHAHQSSRKLNPQSASFYLVETLDGRFLVQPAARQFMVNLALRPSKLALDQQPPAGQN